MITVTEARQLITDNCTVARVETLPLSKALDYTLARSAHCLIDSPPFNQSAMDGYAISFDGWGMKKSLVVKGEIQAGNISNEKLNSSDAIRIYTGAALPPGADTVVMQEKVTANGKTISIDDQHLKKGRNVRLKGTHVKKGDIILCEGHRLTPASISYLAGTGIDKVQVYSKPTVSLIITGKELVPPGNQLPEGKIYESNSFGLMAGLKQVNITPASVQIVDDDENLIRDAVTKQLCNDIIILTGGVSVGAYDYVSIALEKSGVKKIFHKVRQKPGKPFYFGTHNKTLVFALPGNPSAVMCCFYEYIMPAINRFTKNQYFKKILLPLSDDFSKKSGLTYFLKGKINGNNVTILNDQESYMMNSFAMADCLVELDEEKEVFIKGELVNIRMII